jgi:glycosyltransferase involved in cell wall biosynthesis
MSENDKNVSTSLPKVAVIVPCYNHGSYVQQAIMSVVNQDYPMKSIFVSDEGSSDDSYNQIVKLFDRQEQRKDVTLGVVKNTTIVLSKNPNPRGPSGARNRLIQQAWGSSDLFCMLDADDFYLPGKLTKSVMVMSEDIETIGIVYTDALIYHENKNLLIREYREPYSKQRLEQECIVSNTPLINKQALLRLSHLYDESMRTAEDWDLWLRMTSKSVAVHIPEALHVYRVTGKNSSDVVPAAVWQANWAKIRERYHVQ